MTAAIAYLNRRFDVLSLRGAKALGDIQLQQSLFGGSSGGDVCTGVQKLAQRWTLEFLTERGSMPFHMSTRGSDFMRWLRRGFIRSEYDIRAYFNFAAQQVKTNLINEETNDMNPEDRFQEAILLGNRLFDGLLEMHVNVVSLAGDNREVILPIPITPVNLSI